MTKNSNPAWLACTNVVLTSYDPLQHVIFNKYHL